MRQEQIKGHLAALFTVTIWGTTFISTKILLTELRPVEILFVRFVMGYLALLAVCPRPLRKVSKKQEAVFAAAGLCGICLYYLLENIALTYTMATNVGVITSAAPFFTAMLAALLVKSEGKPGINFFLGFAAAMAGVALISLNGSRLELNPLGDVLALSAAFMWGCYSLLAKRISGFGWPVVLTTRRTFFYGILFMLPALSVFGVPAEPARFFRPACLLNLLYLGLGASAVCFVTWNFAVKQLGAVKTSVYIYMVPVLTTVTSALILKEPVTWMSALGTLLAVAGLFLSEWDKKEKP